MRLSHFVAMTILMVLFLTGVVLAQRTNDNKNDRGARSSQQSNVGRRQQGNVEETTIKGNNSNLDNATPGNRSEQTSPSPTRNSDANKDLNDLKDRVGQLEKKSISEDDLGLFYWLPNPIVLAVIAFLIFLALILHLLHLLRVGRLNRDFEQLAIGQRNLAGRTGVPSGKNPGIDRISDQLNQQGQALNQLVTRFNQIDNRFTTNDAQFRDAIHAVALATNWIGEAQLRDAFASDGGNLSESERAATIAVLERFEEPLRQNASRLEPVSQVVGELVEQLQGRTHSTPELVGRVHNLHEGIGRFSHWHEDVGEQLASLRRGSFSERSSSLRADQRHLFEQLNGGSLSVSQMVEKSRAMVEHYFPERPRRGPEERIPLQERETNLKKIVAEAPDYLMDWYNSLSQLQGQLSQVQRTSTDAELAAGLAKVQQMAREALGKFDIQPEAIQIGQTSYDRRLHDAALVRQTAQYPINTIVEVHKCGFRRMSTGEVLRRPQVVVAGAAAS